MQKTARPSGYKPAKTFLGLKPKGWALVSILGLVGGYFGLKAAVDKGYLIPRKEVAKSVVPIAADIPIAQEPGVIGRIRKFALPSATVLTSSKTPIVIKEMAWNSQMGLNLANGGPVTTHGSRMEVHGVNLRLDRQDMYSEMQNELVKTALEFKNGQERPVNGAWLVNIMADGGGWFLSDLNARLAKEVGPDYTAEIIGTPGKSYGEDKLMGPLSWLTDPSKILGALISAVRGDGDWNILIKFARDNNLKVNPDERTYDPDAINCVFVDSFIAAANKYIEGYCEDRPEVKNGATTGRKVKVCVGSDDGVNKGNYGVVTWTPGDVTIWEKKGGLTSIVSTKEYSNQMPNGMIGIKKVLDANRAEIVELLAAMYEANEQVLTDDAALTKAAEISATIYGAETGEYWRKYYKGVVVKDRGGFDVPLGGSQVYSLADARYLFGLDGGTNVLGVTYTAFGNIFKGLYPNLMSSFPSASQVINSSFLAEVSKKYPGTLKASLPRFEGKQTGAKVSQRVWKINFQTGKSTFTPEAQTTLNQLLGELVIAGDLKVEVNGHTDSIGNPQANRILSQERAFAVKQWLQKKDSRNFSDARISFKGYGDTHLLLPDTTENNRKQNRRVEIVLRRVN